MSQKNLFFTDRLAFQSAHMSRKECRQKAFAKLATRRQERHQGKSLLAMELNLLPGEILYQKAVQTALNVLRDFEEKKKARQLAATRSEFREFAQQQCIPLLSLAELNCKTVWEPDPTRKAFKTLNRDGREIVLASCAS